MPVQPCHDLYVIVMCAGIAAVTLGCPGGKPAGGEAESRPALESRFPLAALADGPLCDRLLARDAAQNEVYIDPSPTLRRKVVVSDMHLGPGQHAGPKFAGLEDFFFEAEWAQFLTRQETRGPTDLVIAGDFIEFWQILAALGRLPRRDKDSAGDDEKATLLAADQDSALEALEYVLVAHRGVFTRLGRFVDRGDNRVIFVPGNHDAEILWPRVRLAVARTIGARDPRRLVFVDAVAYRHGGVHVEHGHRFDGANRFAAPHAPFGRDDAGRCRLQSSWGEVFVAHFFNATEQRFPFIDNLYPESAAILWGLDDEPDVASEAVIVAGFLDLLISAESGEFNAAALRGALRGAVGLPDDGSKLGDTGGALIDRLSDRLTSSEHVLNALFHLLSDPEMRATWRGLVAAAKKLPDFAGATKELGAVDPAALGRLRGLLLGDPMTTAAETIFAGAGDIRVVVFGHTHLPGGAAKRLSPGGEAGNQAGYYANTGAWIPASPVRDLKARKVAWTQLSVTDRSAFPAVFPAVVIEYRDGRPQPPELVYTR